MIKERAFLWILITWMGVSALRAQSLAHVREARFGKGANLSNWLEAYWMGANWPQAGKYQKSDLQAMKDAGMKTIRLPFCFYMITDQTAPPHSVNFSSPGIQWLDSVIAWTDALNMNLIIVNQHGWELTNDNYQAKLPIMTAMWEQVANHYAHLDPEQYFFEMLNEPPVGLLPANADIVNNACIQAFRSVSNAHTLVVGPHTASIGSSFATFQPYADTNLIYTFHTYEPLYFTHQGFTWMTPQFPTGVPFPFLGDDGLVTAAVDAAATWRANFGLPVFMGEFGVGIYADDASRCNWIEHLGSLIQARQFNALAWDWGGVLPSDFTMFQSHPPSSQTIIPCFADALDLYAPTSQPEPKEPSVDLAVYPNPSDDQVLIEMGGNERLRSIQILDVAGRLLHQADGLKLHTHSLDLSGIPVGIFILQIETSSGTLITRKLVHR